MHISLDWIQDFVKLPELSPKELGLKFTLTTAEVEDVIQRGAELSKVICVEIKSLKPHPESDKLNLVTFDLGEGKLKEVVCGAPNVAVGLKVPYAPTGVTLPNGMTLEPKKIRGILSDGMLCSEVELGLGEGKSGLMVLENVSPGTPLTTYLGKKVETLLDVDNKSLTHRPDLWGHYGLAREFAASHKLAFKNPFNDQWVKKIESQFNSSTSPVKFEVDENSSCLAYYGLSLDIESMPETPALIKNRLESVGMRSINAVVDISNYVMVELGIPNHIFDRDKITGQLKIEKSHRSQRFKTLDDVERELIESDTIIRDEKSTLVLAGLMGGAHAGVSSETKKLFIEVANWEAPEVRKTSVRLGLRTDSSQRYEKTLDSNLCYRTLLRIVDLLNEHMKVKVIGAPQVYVNEAKRSQKLSLKITQKELNTVIGMTLEKEMIQGIFERLDFEVKESSGEFEVIIPTYRTTKDIYCKADLVEEVGRMIGYDNITPVSPLLPVKPVRLSTAKVLHRKIQDFMVNNASSLQMMTYPLVGPDLLKKALWPKLNEELVLVNALSVEQDRMRPSLIPSALEMAAQNQKHFDEFSFFEIGRSYLGYENERSQLLVGKFSKKKSSFLEVENSVEKLLTSLSLPFQFTGASEKFKNELCHGWTGLHPHEYLNIQMMGKFTGMISTIHPMVLKNFKMKGFLTLAVIDITEFESRELKDKTKYHPISKFPESSCDFTVVVPSETPAASVLSSLSTLKLKELKSKSIVDVFQLNDSQKTVSLRTVFEDSEKTLEAQTIKDLESKIIQTLEKSGFPLKA